MSWLDAIRRLLGIRGTEKVSPKPASSASAEKERLVEAPATRPPVKPAPARRSAGNGKQSSPLTGDMTQFPSINSSSPKLLLNIGLDFGTAFAKVVIGETRTSYAVPFDLQMSGNPYLLPCVVYIDDSGRCSLQPQSDVCEAVTDMKMKLLDGTATHQDLVSMVAFIALILRHTRLWLLENKSATYEGHYLDWYINVGVPTDSYHHEELVETYHKVVMAAWALSVVPDPVQIDVADELLSYGAKGGNVLPDHYAGQRQRMIHPEALGLFPEFVAQVVGYVRSPLRKSDLHMIVDVGAGTVDISIFNVHVSDGDDLFPIFAKAVKPLGTNYLMKHRNNKLPAGANIIWSLQERTPSQSELLQVLKIPMKQLNEIDNDFTKQIGTTVRELLKYTKESRYPGSRRWQEGVPTFLCGGGGKVEVYSEIIGRFENGNHAYKIRVERLPKPQRLTAPQLPDNSYDRLSVAYGLSYNAFDIGQIIQASEIEDVRPSLRNPDSFTQNYVGKEQV
ncbi:MAG: hypothetical protein PHF56_01820 [Desulfuromonadaceae bacterium]|nr:hypothetical protein [Desulfuromonadaceae bacterium]